MSDLDDKLERMQADGKITTHDADEVRNFAAFLSATAGIPIKSDDRRTPEQSRAFGDAYRKHYPEDWARAVAEEKARRAASDAAIRADGSAES